MEGGVQFDAPISVSFIVKLLLVRKDLVLIYHTVVKRDIIDENNVIRFQRASACAILSSHRIYLCKYVGQRVNCFHRYR